MGDNRFFDFLENKMMPVMSRIGNQRHLSAVKNGMVGIIPFTILGSLCLILRFPPIDPSRVGANPNFFIKMLLAWKAWAEANAAAIMMPYQMTMALLGFFAVVAISYNLAKTYKLNLLSSVSLSVMSYLIVSAPAKDGTLPMQYLDSKGLFTAIIVGILAVEILRIMDERGLKIKMPDGVPPAVANSFGSLIPGFVLLITFYFGSLIIQSTTGMILPKAIMAMMAPLVSAVDSPVAIFLTAFLCQLLWFAGIHGANTVLAVLNPFLIQNWTTNAELRIAGEQMQYIFTRPFWSYYIVLGGSGATLGLAFMLLWSRSKQLKSVGKVAILPALFNINEPIIFGAPLVLNPIMFFPFVFTSPILGVIAYYVTKWGWVGKSFTNAPWTTPAPIGAFLTTLDWRAPILIVALTIISAAIYYPFFKAYEKQLVEENAEKNNSGEVATA